MEGQRERHMVMLGSGNTQACCSQTSSPVLTPTREYALPQGSTTTKVDANPALCPLDETPELSSFPAKRRVSEAEEKRDREHKKRSKNWTRPEILKLIRLRTDLEPRFAKAGRKTELWDEIAEALQKERFLRDAQQCRDKWEKLTAGYKEVRDGFKDREDNPFYDELHPLLSGKQLKRDVSGSRPGGKDALEAASRAGGKTSNTKDDDDEEQEEDEEEEEEDEEEEEEEAEEEEEVEGRPSSRNKRRIPKYIAVTDLVTVHNLLETVIAKQQRFFRELLEAMERKEQFREQLQQEKEEKRRAEERAERLVFNNAMLTLTQKLVAERLGIPAEGYMAVEAVSPDGQGPKKRSKNWKRTEVLQLIKLRGEMENKFARSTRRAALWDELADLLKTQGVKRDGKQCREKWDKLMAEYKDVVDGKREQGESHYFAELTAIVSRPCEPTRITVV